MELKRGKSAYLTQFADMSNTFLLMLSSSTGTDDWRNSLSSPLEMIATQEQMVNAQVPLHGRDYCAHILIPLNM